MDKGPKSMPGHPHEPVAIEPTEFAQEVTREILRQNAEILKSLLNPMVYVEPTNLDIDIPQLLKATEKKVLG